MSDSEAQGILTEIASLLTNVDAAGDVACPVNAQLSGSVTAYPSQISSIASQADFDEVLGQPGYVKVVNTIMFCGGKAGNYAGCAPKPGKGIVVVRYGDPMLEGPLWAHEYGHNVGLDHVCEFPACTPDLETRLMYPRLSTTARVVASDECAAFHRCTPPPTSMADASASLQDEAATRRTLVTATGALASTPPEVFSRSVSFPSTGGEGGSPASFGAAWSLNAFQVTSASCRQLCDTQSIQCLRFGLDDKLSRQMQGVLTLFGNSTITKTDLMKTFETASDPCQRSESVVVGGVISNDGMRCQAGENNRLLVLPERMTGLLQARGSDTAATFVDGSEAPLVRFTKSQNLEARYGGFVRDALFTSQHVYLTTTSGCIRVGISLP